MKNPLTDNLRCLSPLRAGRGELERTRLESLFGAPDAVPAKVPLSLSKRERVRVRVHGAEKATQGFFLPKKLDQTDLDSTCRCWTFNWPRIDCNPI